MIRTGDPTVGRVSVEVDLVNYHDMVLAEEGHLAPEKIRRVRVKAWVDSGASYLVLPKSVADQLGVPKTSTARVRYADRRSATRPVVEGVQVELLGRHGTFKAIVEPNREDVLLGAIVLEDLDLLVDCRTQTLQPRDPQQIIAELE